MNYKNEEVKVLLRKKKKKKFVNPLNRKNFNRREIDDYMMGDDL